jgi:hypothetical protein
VARTSAATSAATSATAIAIVTGSRWSGTGGAPLAGAGTGRYRARRAGLSTTDGARAPRIAYAAAASFVRSESRTETSFETPGSSIVTPYSVSTISMVRLLWVMRMNWLARDISFTSSL